MKQFIFISFLLLWHRSTVFTQNVISPCGNQLLEAVQRLTSGITDTCTVGNYTTVNAFGVMSTACYGSVEKPGSVSFTTFYYLDSVSVRVIWGNEQWVYAYYAACAPNPIMYEAPEATQNHVYELRFLPVSTYNSFKGDKTTWASLKDLQTFKVGDIASITNIRLDAPNSALAIKEKADYNDLFSSKGIRCTIKLKNKRTPIECYIYNNYDKAGTIQWKGVVNTEETRPEGYVKFNTKLPFSNYYKDYWVQKDGHNYILNGDIVVGNDLPKPRSLGSDNRDHHWPGGQIPVLIDVSIYEKNQQKLVSDALNTLNNSLEVCYVLRTTQKDYVRIRNVKSDVPGAAGASPVGRQGGEQFVNLSDGASKGNAMHELLHAAGFYHEQSRGDRGKWVNILEANAEPKSKHNFQLEPGQTQGDYDHCSIMHYGPMAFGKTDAAGNQLTTIQCKDANGAVVACPNCMGQRDSVTRRDIQGVDAFYNEISQFACGVKFDLVGATVASKSIAAVSRIPQSMETWWIDNMGAVQGAYWYDNQYWVRYALAPPGSASLQGGITAISRIKNSMEVWWIAPNGSVQGAFWYEGSQWKRYELAPAGSAAPNSKITVASRIPTSMELWWVSPNGSVQGAFWYEGSQWKRYELAPVGSAAVEGGITVSARIRTSMEVWWIAPNGSVQGAFWYEGSTWKRYELAPAGSAATAGGITAVSRIPASMEVWWIGGNGSIQGAFWYEGATWKRYELAPAGSASLTTGIDAVSRIKNSMELWWAGSNGSVQGAFWYEGATWKRYELAPAGSANTGSSIAATSRVSGTMEFFWVGSDGSIQDNFWYENAVWKRFTLAPKL
jgi:Astacin (Peptidase family M12A)